jgi:long-chain acyl-CoA synthetase
MQFKDYRNIHQMLKETADAYSEQSAYKWLSEKGQIESVTWKEFYTQVRSVSKSLMALDVRKGDKVNILSYTSYRWVLTDFGITAAGACTVGIYQSLPAGDCEYIIAHSDAVLVFVEDEHQLKKILDIREGIPNIRKAVLFKGSCDSDDRIISFEAFLRLGEGISDADFEKRAAEAMPSDPAGIVYTSGTTGVPKGAILSHDNITFTAQSIRGCADFRQGDETFLFLPLAHVFARACVYTAALAGTSTFFARGMTTLTEDFKIAKPRWFISVPRIFEKVFSKVMTETESKGKAVLKIFRWACDVGSQMSEHLLRRQPVPMSLDLQYRLADLLVFRKIRAALGGRVSWCISGAAPLNPDIARFFHGAGILILEGIGMTENTSFSNVNRPDNYRFGWVGQPGPGIEQKLAEDGEILFRGRNVMTGYYKMPEETAKTLTEDGWQRSGDLGEIDSENFLRVTGRKKELIITSGGKNIAPAAIELALSASKYIQQVCVIGDRRNYLTALVTPEPDSIKVYAEKNGIAFGHADDLLKNEKIIKLIEAEIVGTNKGFASYQTVKKFRLVPAFTVENGFLTPTFKLKKNLILNRYKDEIEAMYSEEKRI